MNAQLSHMALLVSSVEKSAAVLTAQGFRCGAPEVFASEGSKEIYVGDAQDQSGLLLLVEPHGAGPYHKAMEKRGPSMHHIAIDVIAMKNFLGTAEKLGWRLHPISNSKTSWLFRKGLPLLEIHEKRSLPLKPLKISKIFLPGDVTPLKNLLGSVFASEAEISFIMDGKKIKFDDTFISR